MTSHAESRDHLWRLVGKTDKLAAIYVVLTIYSYTNIQLWWCRVLLWGCASRCVDSSLAFHRIPKEEKRRQLWLNAIKRKGWTPTSNDRVCGRHFIAGLNRFKY